MTDYLPDGVYLGLPAADYFAQGRMGSSDWIRIQKTGAGWWWGSHHNPDRVEKTSKAMMYGSALHAIMLEGVPAYEAMFAVEPDPRDYIGLVTSIPEIKAALEGAGFSLAGTSKWAKPDWCAEVAAKLPDVPCWANLYEDFEARIGRRSVITAVEDRTLRFMHRVATDPTRPDNAAVRKLLIDSEDHPALAEVTVLATVDGIRRRWRMDRMYPGITMDLKSVGQWRGRPLAYEVGQVLAQNCWDLQMSDYFIGRTEAYRLIREGKLFGGTLEQRHYIEQIVEENPTWDWVWLTYGKPETTGSAPVLLPLWADSWAPADPYKPDDPPRPTDLRQYGLNKLNRAIAFYRRMVAEFGLDRPWAHVEDLHFVDADRQPQVHMPHWVQDDEPTSPDAYAEDSE